ncbi:MAG: 1-acylglycerol-3-phosphate O-acyltransferase [Terriglobia bacterium]|jgi:1-acyl-sn-glycerol-3-phosphate acyltransferase|nr:1-acylglycerol-3-phosphate O-acyltransferase [Terriglobia bacterium]
MLRAALLLVYFGLYTVVAGLVGFSAMFITGSVDFLYKIAVGGALFGTRLVGIRSEVIGREQLDPKQTYIFMANHVSNIDPPVFVPLIGRRVFILVKKELFRIPVLGHAMQKAQFIAVDRENRDAAVESVKQAIEVLRTGLSMMAYPEGTRSRDGKLLPFKKGPFHLAMDSGIPVVPVTIVGAHEIWPKGYFRITPGKITIVFHAPIDPHALASREELMELVRANIESALPEKYRSTMESRPQ